MMRQLYRWANSPKVFCFLLGANAAAWIILLMFLLLNGIE